jgi:hypothetical protein
LEKSPALLDVDPVLLHFGQDQPSFRNRSLHCPRIWLAIWDGL